jgi:hypothetical protein
MEENDYTYTPDNIPPSDVFLKAMIEVEETLQKFKMETLKRQILSIDYKNKTKKYVPIAPGIKPVCNDLGIAEIMGMVRGRVTVLGRLTKKRDDEIVKDMFQFHRTLIETFSLRADDWDLDEELIKPIMEACISLVEDVVYSSRDGFTAMNIKSTYSRHETANMSSEEKRKFLGVNV